MFSLDVYQRANLLELEALFNQHRQELHGRLVKIVHCPETAKDIVQETFIILAKTAHSQLIEHPRAFLFRVATNLALDHIKHSKVVQRHADTSSEFGDDHEAPSPERILTQQERLLQFKSIVEELPPRCRDAFILYKVHGLTYREIAAELDISQSGVEKHIMKGLAHCRRRFLEEFGALPKH